MIILPAIDLKDGKCVRLVKGDYSTAEVVAADPIETAKSFAVQGASWLHLVDLDGAKDAKPQNAEVILDIRKNVDLKIEVGGGIRNMETVDYYIENGIDRVILGSAALKNPEFVKEAVQKYGAKIAVGIDALVGKVAAEGWLDTSEVDYLEFAKQMEAIGIKYLIVTDIDKDGTLAGPNLEMLKKIDEEVSCNIIASGGVSSMGDIVDLYDLNLYGAITGKAVYTGNLNLQTAIVVCEDISKNSLKSCVLNSSVLERFFHKNELIPAVIQEDSTGEVLMLAYMNCDSLLKSIETGYTWFYSRSRKKLWNKGETSGNVQQIVSIHGDCDDDTLLIKVIQSGPACHTGAKSCFFNKVR